MLYLLLYAYKDYLRNHSKSEGNPLSYSEWEETYGNQLLSEIEDSKEN